ncbi:histidine phosphatase family protein, partial [Escherichia coli]|nr:histidine phosphatase family protein [Escherichia coli]
MAKRTPVRKACTVLAVLAATLLLGACGG